MSLSESAAKMWHFSTFLLILGDDGTIYSIIMCKISPDVYHYLLEHTQNKYCNTLETMNGCLCSPSSHLTGWESTPKCGIIGNFWERNLLVVAQHDTNKAGRRLFSHVLSYICIQARF